MDNAPQIVVFALGGTIAMTSATTGSKAESGAMPTLGADALVSAVPQLADVAEITSETLVNVGSANLDFSCIQKLCQRAQLADCDGIVVTQGTDTLEETAFLASLLYEGDKPLIFTGAMRTPGQLSADGPTNLFDAVLTACALEGGVYVVMNREIHDPWRVCKMHTTDLGAFQSPGTGAVGRIIENAVHLELHEQQAPLGLSADVCSRPVALLQAGLGDDTRLLKQILGLGYEGLVIEAYGAGHLSEDWADCAVDIAKHIPVILSSRCTGGAVLEATYGYKGAEMDLIQRGLIPAGNLKSRKARHLLSLLLADRPSQWLARFLAIKASF